MLSITFLIPYFGKFPEWAPLYFETVRKNDNIDFIFYTDCDTTPYEHLKNVKFYKMSFSEYVNMAIKKANISFKPANAYKLCDLRPLYPIIHFEDIKESDFYGWTDMDIIFGDIRSFYTEEILNNYDVFSTHKVRVSGHMALFRNTSKYRNLYLKIYDWRNKLAFPNFVGIDEHGVTNALTMTFFDKLNEKFGMKLENFVTKWLKKQRTKKLYMVEQFTTPFTSIPWIDGSINSNHPSDWVYKNGEITNSRNGDRTFLYLHFMNFKSSTYRHDGSLAPWEGKIDFYNVKNLNGIIIIDNQGIRNLN